MKRVYVVGSFKDLETSKQVIDILERAGLSTLISEPGDPNAIDGCLGRIDCADIVYVSNPRGEIGKSVSIDLGYAIAKQKPIYSMRSIQDPPVGHHVRAVVEPEALITHLR